MPGFSRVEADGLVLWAGDPSGDAAHAEVLVWITDTGQPFFPENFTPSPAIVGNLAELIVFRLGHMHVFTLDGISSDALNVTEPFANISRPGIDIVWVYFGEQPNDDWVVLQEVKATANPDLHYADDLLEDYAKLFDSDPRFTLRTRLDALKNKLEYQWNRPEDAKRLTAIGGPSPARASRVRIIPSCVHESEGADPTRKMLIIREALIGRGWRPEAITCWSVGMDDFANRMSRLASGN